MKYQYISYQETLDFYAKASQEYPELISTQVIGKTWENRDILLVTISKDVKNADTKPALLYTGTIHAREWIGIELAVEFTKHIIEQIDMEPLIDSLLHRATIYLVPCLNPDGFEYSRNHFSFWRKNRRQNADGSFGVDLNRNFPIGFKPSNNPTSNIYGGPAPFSEPETAAMRDFVEAHDNITIALDYHSQGNVFFPAHDFRHEDTPDTTDMNVLCANMADCIKKVSGREYGIHQGKPPASLISGSGREYYYSKGAIATVVEVGSRNISDYIENMSENTQENIPALLEALKEVPNYSKDNHLEKIQNFKACEITEKELKLTWEYDSFDDIYFEIYRAKDDKSYCKYDNLIKVTKAREFVDTNLDSSTAYYYYIRAVDKKRKLKSSYAPRVKVRTLVEDTEFFKVLYPIMNETGYVAQKFSNNKKHFGVNSMFIGIDEKRGISYGVCSFALDTIPANAIIKEARVSLYPINRVSTTIEKFGEWNVGIVDQNSVDDIYDFNSLDSARVLQYVGRPTKSQHLTQGIWRKWPFSNLECKFLQEQLAYKKVLFRVDGPRNLRFGRTSQMMQWDIGYGKFGYGLEYRPQLSIKYTLPTTTTVLKPYTSCSTKIDGTQDIKKLKAGFDDSSKKIYSIIEYDLSTLPSFDENVVAKASFSIDCTKSCERLPAKMRFYVVMLEHSDEYGYQNIKDDKILDRIGFDVSIADIKANNKQTFIFDTLPLQELQLRYKNNQKIAFAIIATSSNKVEKSKSFSFVNTLSEYPKLTIRYIKKRRNPPKQVTNVKLTKQKGKIKLTWKNPKDESFKGVIVVKNPDRVPCDPVDGQKLYGGLDEYTYDSFGALDVDKYIAIFSYDDVPNYSNPVVIEYKK
jgi:hypothetical protein